MSRNHNFYIKYLEKSFKLELVSLILVLLFSYTPIKAQIIHDIIFTQVPVNEQILKLPDDNSYSPGNQYVQGCRIVSLLSNSIEPINLTPEFYSASDPDISFDGNYIIFSGKKDVNDFWQIWQMKIDGSEKTQITKESGDCYMPVYAGNRFYLDDPSPTPQIIYVGTSHNWKNNIESGPVHSLYGTNITGTEVHRLTFNLFSDFAPDVLRDGRIVFSSIQFSGRENLSTGKMALFVINNDGTDLMAYYGNHEGPIYKNDIHISDIDQHCYFVESNNSDYLGGGNIAYLSQRRPLHSYSNVKQTKSGFYKNPSSLPDGDLIVSYRSEHPEDVYSLYNLNSVTGEQKELLPKNSKWHSLDVQISRPHPKVKGRSNWLIPGTVTGVFYCLNSYQTSLTRDIEVNQGDFKFVRVIEGLPIEGDTKSKLPKMKFAPARIIGVAPVENDGSFHVRVPAEIPISFQMLDKNKMAIDRHDSWTWVIGNESRGCIGCHENRELTPVNRLVDAVTKPPVELTPTVENRRIVDYLHQIAPIVKTKCATELCHVSGKSDPILEGNNFEIYTTLLKPIKSSQHESYVNPGFAKKSPLIWHLFGERLISDKDDDTNNISKLHQEIPLSEKEIQLFIEWIDMGAQWDLRTNNPVN